MALCVVDASVLVKLFVPEDGSESAVRLLADAGSDRRRVVPDLALVECASVLWKWVRRGMLSADIARQSVADLNLIPLDVWPHDELVAPALELALSYGITVYDAIYVALADRLGCPVVTGDAALVQKLAAVRSNLQLLQADSSPHSS